MFIKKRTCILPYNVTQAKQKKHIILTTKTAYLIDYIIILFPQKMKITLQNNKNKSLYQEYRSRARSELDCSSLLSGLSELDNQMSKYDELRKQRMSQSGIFDESEVFTSSRLSVRETSKEEPDDLLLGNEIPVLEYQNVKLPNAMKSSATSRPIDLGGKFNKDKHVTSGLPKQQQAEVKLKQEKREKMDALKTKTKQLQQQYMQLFASDILKKSTVTKQFNLLLKLLQ